MKTYAVKKLAIALVAMFLIVIGVGPVVAQKASDKPVVKLDPGLDALVSPDAKLELVKSGFGFTEGALWVQNGKSGYLLFSDIPANVIYKWTPDGKVSIYLDHSGYTGRDIWRVGFIQTNGKDRNDPLFEEFPMLQRTRARPTEPPHHRDVGRPVHRSDRKERQAHCPRRSLRRKALQWHQ